MNKQELEARIMQIDNEMTQLKANYAKAEGHLAECQHWMMELIKKETEEMVAQEKAANEEGDVIDIPQEDVPH